MICRHCFVRVAREEVNPLRRNLFRQAADQAAVALEVVVAAALMISVSAGSGLAAPVSHGDPAQPGLARFYHQQPAWKACGDKGLDALHAQCADVTVPLDYTKPDGRTISVAISRLKATDPAKRRGIMLTNPGGPGGAGLNFTVLGRKMLSPEVSARYDLIGMDPRGIGRSAPVHCDWLIPLMLRSAGQDLTSYGADVALQAAMAAGCLHKDPEKLRLITTRNTARDMDVIRGMLGEQKINYFGLSYGTYLGAVFTQMFPHRSDRIVLDSALDPDRYWLGTVQDMGASNEAALDGWAKWAAARNATYRLGATGPQVRAVLEDLIRRSAVKPILVERLPLDQHLLPMIVLQLLSDPRLNPLLSDIVRLMVDTANGRPGQLDPQDRGLLKKAAAMDGSGMAAIVCSDVAAPRDPAWYWHNIEAARAKQPVFGAFANNIEACAFWPEPVEPTTVVRNAVPALILQSTDDPRTAYRQGVALHRDMTGSRLVTLRDIRVHVTYRPGLSACLNAAVDGYLVNGTLPRTDLSCHGDPAWADRPIDMAELSGS